MPIGLNFMTDFYVYIYIYFLCFKLFRLLFKAGSEIHNFLFQEQKKKFDLRKNTFKIKSRSQIQTSMRDVSIIMEFLNLPLLPTAGLKVITLISLQLLLNALFSLSELFFDSFLDIFLIHYYYFNLVNYTSSVPFFYLGTPSVALSALLYFPFFYFSL